MAFSFFKGRESVEPAPLAEPIDLLVDAQQLLTKLSRGQQSGLGMQAMEQMYAGLVEDVTAWKQSKKLKPQEAGMLADAEERLHRAKGVLQEWRDAEPLPEEQVELMIDASVATWKKDSKERNRENQDASLIDTEHEVFGVFDGLGGQAAGEKASRSAVRTIQEAAASLPKDVSSGAVAVWMRIALLEANEKIHAESFGDGRGTTASVVKIWEGPNGERKAIIGNVGDSRVYRYRASSHALEQLTIDDSTLLTASPEEAAFLPKYFARDASGLGEMHALLQAFLRREQVTAEQVFAKAPKSPEEASTYQAELNSAETDEDFGRLSLYAKFYYEFSNLVSQSLGGSSVDPHVSVTDVLPGDLLVMTSDGIHDNLSDGQIKDACERSNDADRVAHRLAKEAQEVSFGDSWRSKKDDVTAVAVKVG